MPKLTTYQEFHVLNVIISTGILLSGQRRSLRTTDNTKHRTQNSNWVHNRHKPTTSTRRNKHTTNKGTPPTTRITYKTKITTPHTPTTLHHNTTNNTQT